jgi:hypothetical protein
VKTFKHPPKVFGDTKFRVAALLWVLVLEGDVHDPKGTAVKTLQQRLARRGVVLSDNRVGTMVNWLSDGDAVECRTYPYEYIHRETRDSKRTFDIELIVDHEQVPFPPNPFKEEEKRRAPRELPIEKGETFGRQRQFERTQTPEPVETEKPRRRTPRIERREAPLFTPEDEGADTAAQAVETEVTQDELDVLPADIDVAALASYQPPDPVAADTNGRDDDLLEFGALPEDLLALVAGEQTGSMIDAAITLLCGSRRPTPTSRATSPPTPSSVTSTGVSANSRYSTTAT